VQNQWPKRSQDGLLIPPAQVIMLEYNSVQFNWQINLNQLTTQFNSALTTLFNSIANSIQYNLIPLTIQFNSIDNTIYLPRLRGARCVLFGEQLFFVREVVQSGFPRNFARADGATVNAAEWIVRESDCAARWGGGGGGGGGDYDNNNNNSRIDYKK